MIIKCKKCGNEYELGSNEKLSDFECGGELYLNNMVSEPAKTLKTPKRFIEEDLNKKGKSKKNWIARACCIGFILILVFGGMIFSNNTTSGNNTTYIPNNTYSGNGLTFNYPLIGNKYQIFIVLVDGDIPIHSLHIMNQLVMAVKNILKLISI